MAKMFKNCQTLKNLDLNYFDTKNVTDMSQMFSECSGLKEIYINKFGSDGDIYESGMHEKSQSFKI